MNDTMTAPVTFVVFTFNEASRIERVVRNLRGAGPVLVVDNHSADDTREIAARFGARVLLNKNPGWVEDEVTARVVKDAVDTPWIYWGYADEMMSQETLDHLMSVVADGRHDVITIGKKNYFYGSFCENAFTGGALPRLFRKEAIDFTGNTIHNFGKITVPDTRVVAIDADRYFVHQFISHSTSTMLNNLDRYSAIEAERKASPAPAKLIAGIFKTFLVNYIVRRAYKAGRDGFYYCFYNLIYDIFLAMRRHEREHGYDRAAIERRNDRWRDAILHGQENAIAAPQTDMAQSVPSVAKVSK